jgi:hypothetical protein
MLPLELIGDKPGEKPRRKVTKLYLYAIRAEPSGTIKIGTTRHPQKRLNQIRSANHEQITLLFAISCEKVDELVVHGHLNPARIRGEWYRPTPEVLAWVERRLHA